MPERTERDLLIVDDFRGVNQAVDEVKLPEDLTPWSHGGYFNERAEFERLQGKKLNSSNTTGGHILTLHQLEFSDRSLVVIHQSSNWFVEDDVTELMTEDPVPPVSPLEPLR